MDLTGVESQMLTRNKLTKVRAADFDRNEQHIQTLLKRIDDQGHTANMSDLLTRYSLDVVTHIFFEDSANSLLIRDFPFGKAMDNLQAFNTIRTTFGYVYHP